MDWKGNSADESGATSKPQDEKNKTGRIENSLAIPPGLECLYDACKKLYPTQQNPLQVTALVKYW